MKNRKPFFLSILITVLVLGAAAAGYHYLFGVKDSYTISSSMAVRNSNGIIKGHTIEFEDCKNSDGNFELEITVGSQENRKIGFEIAVLINYEQQVFQTDFAAAVVISNIMYIDDSEETFKIILDEKAFPFKQNLLILQIRQDIDEFSYRNTFVRNSDTVHLQYYVQNSDGDQNPPAPAYTHTNITKLPIAEEGNKTVFKINRNSDEPLIELNKEKELALNITVGGSELTEEYLILAFLNSHQARIDGWQYCYIKSQRGMAANININVEIFPDAGIYELELCCVPAPYGETDRYAEIISARRYTIEVEE